MSSFLFFCEFRFQKAYLLEIFQNMELIYLMGNFKTVISCHSFFLTNYRISFSFFLIYNIFRNSSKVSKKTVEIIFLASNTDFLTCIIQRFFFAHISHTNTEGESKNSWSIIIFLAKQTLWNFSVFKDNCYLTIIQWDTLDN